jgi:TRAP-type uncharacterized transport system fused permease subunit
MRFLQGKDRPTVKELKNSFLEGFEMIAVLSLLLIAIGPLGQVFLTTNLSGRLGTFLISVLPESKLLLLFGAAGLAIILGMGLPTPVAYLIVALALVPFLQELGVNGLIAHFFVFYFAVYSALTPPIAVASLAGAKIAGASVLQTCRDSMKLASTTFIIPFAFVYRPELMSFPNFSLELVWILIEVMALQFMLAVGLFGHCFRPLKTVEKMFCYVVCVGGFLSLIDGRIETTVVAIVVYVLLVGWFFTTKRKFNLV